MLGIGLLLCALLLKDLYPGLLELDLGPQRVEPSPKRKHLLIAFSQLRRKPWRLKRTQEVDISLGILDPAHPEALLLSEMRAIPPGLQLLDRSYLEDEKQPGRTPAGKENEETIPQPLALSEGRSCFLGLLEHPLLQHGPIVILLR